MTFSCCTETVSQASLGFGTGCFQSQLFARRILMKSHLTVFGCVRILDNPGLSDLGTRGCPLGQQRHCLNLLLLFPLASRVSFLVIIVVHRAFFALRCLLYMVKDVGVRKTQIQPPASPPSCGTLSKSLDCSSARWGQQPPCRVERSECKNIHSD